MKNPFIFLIPVAIFAVVSALGSRLLASGSIHPAALVAILGGVMLLSALIRPKNSAGKAATDATLSIMGELAQDAFANDPKLAGKYRSAVADYVGNMPKSAQNKLTQLQSQCVTDADTYAVSVALGMVKSNLGDFEAAIKLYDRAVVLCPTTELAAAIGSCYQRLGKLSKAIDSYEFALDLDPDNLDARSSLATAHVANGHYSDALEVAQLVLDRDENHASALATCAICSGLLNDSLLCRSYTEKAVANGYNENKIKNTIDTLKKRNKR